MESLDNFRKLPIRRTDIPEGDGNKSQRLKHFSACH